MVRKKKVILFAGIFAAAAVFLCWNVFAGQNKIRSCTYSEIESRGYPASEICDVKIDHSYLRRIAGYNEWRISVEFEKEPSVFFWFSYKDNKMVFEGVSSEPMMDTDMAIEYSEKFKSGILLVQ